MRQQTGILNARQSFEDAARSLWRVLSGNDVRNGTLAVLDQGIVSGLSFATAAIIADACGSVGLGVAHLVLTFVVLMMNVQGELILAPYTVYRSRRSGSELAVYSGSMLAHQLIGGAVAVIALLTLLIASHFTGSFVELAPAARVLSWAAPLILLHSFLRHLAFACFQFRIAVWMDIVVAIVQLAVLITLHQVDLLTVPRVFAAMGVATGLAASMWLVVAPEPMRMRASHFWSHWRENWSFGRWTLASHLVGCAMTYVLPWLLVVVHDEAATGTLAGCGKLSALAATFVLGVANFLTPKAVAAFKTNGWPALRRVLTTIGFVFVASVGMFCVLIWMSGDWLMPRLFGNDFASTGNITTVLAFAVLLNSLAVLAGNGLWAIDRPQANLFGDVCAMLATLAVALWLVADHGVLGIAVSIAVGGGVGAVTRGATLWLLVRCLRAEGDRC